MGVVAFVCAILIAVLFILVVIHLTKRNRQDHNYPRRNAEHRRNRQKEERTVRFNLGGFTTRPKPPPPQQQQHIQTLAWAPISQRPPQRPLQRPLQRPPQRPPQPHQLAPQQRPAADIFELVDLDALALIDMPAIVWAPMEDNILNIGTMTPDAQRTNAKAAANNIASTPGGRADVYIELAQNNTSDGQNSHDPGVNIALRSIVERLQRDQGANDNLYTIDDIKAYIREHANTLTADPHGVPRMQLVERAEAILDRSQTSGYNSTIGTTEEVVMRRVWTRSFDPRNRGNANSMRQAFFDALIDSWQEGLIVCINGRCGRILSSLAMLDFDRDNWQIQRVEQVRNDILLRTKEAIHAAAEEATMSNDPRMQDVGRSYLSESLAELDEINVDSHAEEQFIKATSERISSIVDEYASQLPQSSLEVIRRDALAAI